MPSRTQRPRLHPPVSSGRVIAYYIIGIASTAMLAWVISALYPRYIPFESKVSRGYLSLAYKEALADSAGEGSRDNLARLVRALTLKGNLGRAELLAQYAGVEDELLALAREFQVSVLEEAKRTGTVANHFASGRLAKLRNYPVYQDLKFFVGFQHALLGDWRAAKDYFEEANRAGVSPQLKPYLQYYLGRSLTIKGDEKERARGYKLLAKLAGGRGNHSLTARVSLNQLQAAIEANQEGLFKVYLPRIRYHSKAWEHPKALVDLGNYYLKKGEPVKAADYFLQALGERPAEAALRNSAAVGLAEAMELIDGKLGELRNVLTTSDGQNTLAEWVKALVENGKGELAIGPLRQSSLDDSNLELRFLAMEAVGIAYSATRKREEIERLLVSSSQLRQVPQWLMQSLYLEYAQLLQSLGETMPAINNYKKAHQFAGPRANEARYGEYDLMKARFPALDIGRSIELLETVVKLPAGKHRLQSAEELIALAELAGKRTIAEEAALSISGEAPDLGLFWRIHFASANGDTKGAELLRSQVRVKRFSYYELRPLQRLGEYAIEHSRRTFYLQPETAEEYLAGHFIDGLVSQDAAGQLSKQAITEAIALRNLELTASVKSSSWAATEALEEGNLFDLALLGYILRTAYPTPYRDEVEAASKRYGIPPELIYAVMKKESNFDPNATSRVGARGLMQLMPATAEMYRQFLPQQLRGRSLADPECSIHLGAAYLASMRTSFVEDHLVLSAYNGGPGNVNRWLRIVGTRDPVLYVELIPNNENEQFVKKTLKYAIVYGYLLAGESPAKARK